MNSFKWPLFHILLCFLFSCSSNKKETVSNVEESAKELQITDTLNSNKPTIENAKTIKIVPKSKYNHFNDNSVIEGSVIEEEGSMAALYRELDKKPERFELNTLKDTVIRTASGSYLTIQANSFFTNGKITNGSVLLEVKEYITKGDFLLANLSTNSNGKMLESGGMFHLKATNGTGEECTLAKGKTIQMKVPIQGEGFDDMGIFYGQHGAHNQVNWQLDSKNKVTRKQKGKKFKVIIPKEPRRIITLLNTVSVYEALSGKRVYYDSVDYRNDYFSTGSTESMKTMTVDFTLNGNGEVTKQNILDNAKKIKTNLSFCQWKKKFFKLRVISESSCFFKIKFNKEYFFNIFTSSWLKVGEFHVVPSFFSNAIFPKDKSQDAFRLEMKKMYVYSDTSFRNSENKNTERIAQKLKDSSANLSASEIGYYTMATSQLNFINIDRFYHQKGPKVEMYVIDAKGADLKLVFDKINSVLAPTGSNAFIQIPKNEPVTLFALKMKGKTPYMALKKMTTKEGAVNDLEYLPTTVEEIKNQLANL